MSIVQTLLAEPDQLKWRSIKQQAIANIVPSLARTARHAGVDVQIVGTQVRDGLLQILFRAWKDGQQIGFGADGSVDIERLYAANPAVLVADPTGPIIRNYPDGVRRYREDPQEALLLLIEHVVAVKKQKVVGSSRIVQGKIGSTTWTDNPQPGSGTAPIDGWTVRGVGSETFSTIRNGTGTGFQVSAGNNNAWLGASTTTDQFNEHRRGVFGFDTNIGAGATISSVTLSLMGNGKTNGLGAPEVGITAFTPTAEDNLQNSDYDVGNYGSTEFATRISYASWNTSGSVYNVFTFNASGEAAINKTANTFFAARLGWDIDNSFGGSWSSSQTSSIQIIAADAAGTSQDPLITIEYTTYVYDQEAFRFRFDNMPL